MNPEEAQLILQCRRAQGQDNALPAMAEAWQTLNHLPEARAALEADAALDALIGQTLRRFEPPSELRRIILTGARITPQLPWWRRRSVIFTAAALVMAGLSVTLIKPAGQQAGHETTQVIIPPELEEFRQAITTKLNQDQIHFSKASSQLEDLQTWLANHSTSPPATVPVGLAPLPTHGCEVFEWKGHEVTLVCFETKDSGTVHLFTIKASDLPMDLTAPLPASANGWETITWKQDGKIMQLIGQTSPEALRALILSG